jgi:hypothetical protein
VESASALSGLTQLALGGKYVSGSWTNPFLGYLDALRVSATSRYSGSTYTVPSPTYTADASTRYILPLDGTLGSTTLTTDAITYYYTYAGGLSVAGTLTSADGKFTALTSATGNFTGTLTSATLSSTNVNVLAALTSVNGNFTGTLTTATLSSTNATVSGTLTTSNGLTAGGLIHMYSPSYSASTDSTTTLKEGSYFFWNYISGATGETVLWNNAGSGSGGFWFYNSTGNGSSMATGKTLLAYLNSSGNLVTTGSVTSKSQAVPVSQSGTVVLTTTSTGTNSVDFAMGVSITPSSGYATVMVMNGDQAANYTFHPLNGHLMNASGTTNTPFTHIRMVYMNSIAAPSRVHWQVIYIP